MSQHPAPRFDTRTGAPRPRPGLARVAALATLALVGIGATAAIASSAGSSSATRHATASTVDAKVAHTFESATPSVASEERAVSADVQPEPDPQPEPQPATPGDLEVSTNSIDLPDNVYDGSFEVRNDGGSPIDWHWLMGDYGIAVDVDGGTLAPGESVTVHFSINPFQLPVGDFLFANCVYNDDQAKDVHITGHRPQFKVNPDAQQPGLGLTK